MHPLACLLPVCVTAQEPVEIVVFSIKLGLALFDKSAAAGNVQHQQQVAILLVSNNTLLHQAVGSRDGNALFRFTVPAGVLEPSVITAYVALCNEHGSVVKVADTGKLLVLDADAAAEVRDLFSKTTAQVQQLLCGCTSSSAAGSRPQRQWRSHTWVQQAFSVLLTKLGGRQQGAAPTGSGNSVTGQSVVAAGASPNNGVAPAAASVDSQELCSQHPDAATLYVYEHFFVPFLRQWVAAFSSPEQQELSQHRSMGISLSDMLSAQSTSEAQLMQLMGLLVDRELWACSLFVLGRYPGLAAHMQRAGMRSSDEEASSPLLLEQLRVVLQAPAGRLQAAAHTQPAQPQAQQPHLLLPQQQQHQHQQQQQHQQQHQPFLLQQQQQAAYSLASGDWRQQQQQQQQLLQIPSDVALMQYQVQYQQVLLLQQQLQAQNPALQQPSLFRGAASGWLEDGNTSPNGSDESVESASEILVRLGLLQQARGEQEALEDFMQQEQQRTQPHHQLPAVQQCTSASSPLLAAGCGHSPTAHTAPSNVQPTPATCAPATTGLDARPPIATGAAVGGGRVALGSASGASSQLAEQAASQSLHALCQPMPGQLAVSPALASSTQAAAASGAGLRQRRAGSVFTGSLFSKQRKLSWEEEQPEPVPKPLPLLPLPIHAGGVAAEGWYPGSWQLPEPSSNLALAARLLGAPGFAGVPPVPPMGSCAGPVCGMQGVDDDDEDPYSVPSFGAVGSCAGLVGDMAVGSGGSTVVQDVSAASTDDAAGLSCSAAAEELLACASKVASQQCSDSADKGCCDRREEGSSSFVKGSPCWSTPCGSSSRRIELQHPPGPLSWCQPWQLFGVCCTGFRDRHLEASYLVFKNHGCSLLDATAGFICTSMLMTSSLKSLDLVRDRTVWYQLMTMAVYSVFFFLPYIIMKLQLQLFLRLREPLLVVGRNVGAVILAIMACGYLPMVTVWRNVVVNTLSLQIQNGFILPACQQVRPHAALMIALVHVPADAIWLAAGKSFRLALLHSTVMQMSSMLVTLSFDAWCRLRFLQRYSGVISSGQEVPLLGQRQV